MSGPVSLAQGTGAAFDLVVFDWDGTLIDSTATIVDALQASARDLDLVEPSRERAAHVIGLGLLDAIRYAIPGIPDARLPAFVERYRAHYLARDGVLRPFEGIVDLLEDLKRLGVPVAVATGKSRAGLDRALDQMAWNSLFVDTRCADQGIPKPDPWMLRDICDVLMVDPKRTVMIGDTSHDLQMAAALGSSSVAVTYGAHRREDLQACGPAALVDDVAGLREWLWPRLAAARQGLADGLYWQAVCDSESLANGGEGIRFAWNALPPLGGRPAQERPAFVVRQDDRVHAYLNQCAHVPVELDWPAGRFFDDSGLYLICATHGATYRVADGVCIAGPCRGRSLIPLHATDLNGKVWVAFEGPNR